MPTSITVLPSGAPRSTPRCDDQTPRFAPTLLLRGRLKNEVLRAAKPVKSLSGSLRAAGGEAAITRTRWVAVLPLGSPEATGVHAPVDTAKEADRPKL